MLRRIPITILPQLCALVVPKPNLNRFLLNPILHQPNIISCVRLKHVTSGIQGKRNSKQNAAAKKRIDNDDDDEESIFNRNEEEEKQLDLHDSDYELLASDVMHVTTKIQVEQNVLIIQPYVKWGPTKSPTSPKLKLQEAEDLIRSLDNWNIQESKLVGLMNFDKKTLFGRGKLDELQKLAKKYDYDEKKKISCVFVSKSVLTQSQKQYLEQLFHVPVMDRFSVVIQILRLHATSRESKLQIASAEIPYIWRQFGITDQAQTLKLNDTQKKLLRNREKKIKTELELVRSHRKIIRKKRFQKKFPIVAIVGYTNAGKTSLIKALTNEEKMEPRNQLFATLDITAHGGKLPCNLDVIYMDTIGFMSDIPTGLIECFVATLEDAMLADLIIHVQDLSHGNVVEQRKHVEETLKNLLNSSESESEDRQLLNNIINVGNKCDLITNLNESKHENELTRSVNQTSEPMHYISSTKMTGLSDLMQAIERNILKVTERKKIIIRVPMGGQELPWLYKNTAVTHTEGDPKSSEYLLVHAVITDLALLQFKQTFLKRL